MSASAAAIHRVNLRVRTSVGHGQKTWSGMLSLEVLIWELIAVDGLASSALTSCQNLALSRSST